MTATRIVSLVLVPVLTLLGDLRAQETRPIAPGAMVRVSAPSVVEKRVVGFVVSLDRDTLVLNAEGHAAPLALPLASVTRLEAHTGRKSRSLLGAGIGFGVGAGWGVAVLLSLCNPEETCDAGDVAKAVGILGGIGAGLGALVGSFIKADRWQAVPLDRVRVGLTPHGGPGLALTASVSF